MWFVSDRKQADKIFWSKMPPSKFVISFVLVSVLALSGCVSEEQKFATIMADFEQSIAEDDLSQAREFFEEARLLTTSSDEVASLGRKLQVIELSKKAFLSGDNSFATGKYLDAVTSYLEVSQDDLVRFDLANPKVTETLKLMLSAELNKTGTLSKKDFLFQGSALQLVADFPEARLRLLEPLSQEVSILSNSYREQLSVQISLAISENRLSDAKQFIGAGVLALPKDPSLTKIVR